MSFRVVRISGSLVLLCAWLAVSLNSSPAIAAPPDINSVLDRIEQLQSTVQRQQEEIERLKQQLQDYGENQQKERAAQEQQIQQVKSEIQESIKPLEWAKKLKISGDLRLRYEGMYARESKGKDIDDRNRFRIRLRLYGDSDLTDEIAVHYMLSTSDSQLGQTSNQTLKDEFDNKAVFIARAWSDYRPDWLDGFELGFGKFKNPFLHSDITWDPDVNPEGFYELYTYKGWNTVQPFAKLGQMFITESNLDKDAMLVLWQAGVNVNVAPVEVRLAGSYYDYSELEKSRLGQSDRAKGNTTVTDESGSSILAYDFKVAEVIGDCKFKVAGFPLRLWGDYLVNTAEDVPDDRDTAWGTGIDFGSDKKQGEWKFEYMYKHIESDSVLGLFSDGDFYGTNREGHKWRVTYRLLKQTRLQVSFFDTDSIEGENHENRLQISTIYNF